MSKVAVQLLDLPELSHACVEVVCVARTLIIEPNGREPSFVRHVPAVCTVFAFWAILGPTVIPPPITHTRERSKSHGFSFFASTPFSCMGLGLRLGAGGRSALSRGLFRRQVLTLVCLAFALISRFREWSLRGPYT